MAKERIERMIDDLDGTSKADETVHFGWAAVSYSIDLSKAHARELEKSMAKYVAAASKLPSAGRATGRAASAAKVARPRRAVAAAPAAKVDLSAVRKWALENGVTVANRGRIAQSVHEAYRAASSG